METALKKIKRNKCWVFFVVASTGLIAGCGILQPHTGSLATGKKVNRSELRMEYISAAARLKAKEAALVAERETMVQTYGEAFGDLDAKAEQQKELINAVVPLAGPLMGPYGSLLLPALSALFGGSAIANSSRMNRELAKHNTAKGLTPDGLKTASTPS